MEGMTVKSRMVRNFAGVDKMFNQPAKRPFQHVLRSKLRDVATYVTEDSDVSRGMPKSYGILNAS